MASMEVPAGKPAAARPAARMIAKPTYITWLTLAFMTTASVASLRSAPAMAVYGLTCVFLYLVPAELASGWTGGVFRCVSEGLSPAWGLLAVSCQFAITIFYYPTLLGFVSSTLAYIFKPGPGRQRRLHGRRDRGGVLARRVHVGARRHRCDRQARVERAADRDADPGGDPRHPRHRLSAAGQRVGGADGRRPPGPKWTGIACLVLIVNNFLSYSGMEMNSVHVGSLQNPKCEFSRAMFFACGLVLLIFILPALAISWVIPADQLS